MKWCFVRDCNCGCLQKITKINCLIGKFICCARDKCALGCLYIFSRRSNCRPYSQYVCACAVAGVCLCVWFYVFFFFFLFRPMVKPWKYFIYCYHLIIVGTRAQHLFYISTHTIVLLLYNYIISRYKIFSRLFNSLAHSHTLWKCTPLSLSLCLPIYRYR